MRPKSRSTMSAPSLSVLLFLRSQSEQASSFNPSTSVTACQSSTNRGAKVSRGTTVRALSSMRRPPDTIAHGLASVESSLLNLEFLRPYSERGSLRLSALASRTPSAPAGFPSKSTNASRNASSDTRSLWKKPWKDQSRKEEPSFKTSGSPTLPGFLDDIGNTSFDSRKPVKGSNELRLRCTEFGENGNVTFMDGEFKKSELIAKVSQLESDLRDIGADTPCSMVFSLAT